jgi:hypothetical protein
MVGWWSEQLGVRCYIMAAKFPQLPEAGYHDDTCRGPRKPRSAQTTTTTGNGASTNARRQSRLGGSRRLVDGRWQAPSPNTAMAAALIKAARPRKPDPEQILLSDFGVMPDPNKKSSED